MQTDIDSGRAKSFYNELLDEMRLELKGKEAEHAEASNGYQPLNLDEANAALIQCELKRLIELLDAEVQNPEMLNRLVSKYVSKILIQRETKTIHISFKLKQDSVVLYQNTITADWDMSK